MAEPFIAEIRIFPFDTVPKGWMPCNGQIMSIQQNQALFALLGTQYGGDGKTTFALPNLQGRAAIHPDVNITVGQVGGEETHTLQMNEMPAHTHQATGGSDAGSDTATSPTGNAWGTSFINSYAAAAPDGSMRADALAVSGNSQPHENRQPYAVFQYCIAIQGIFPSRN
jgi:microcystin-dependent protein